MIASVACGVIVAAWLVVQAARRTSAMNENQRRDTRRIVVSRQPVIGWMSSIMSSKRTSKVRPVLFSRRKRVRRSPVESDRL